jgi:hypothetical protein
MISEHAAIPADQPRFQSWIRLDEGAARKVVPRQQVRAGRPVANYRGVEPGDHDDDRTHRQSAGAGHQPPHGREPSGRRRDREVREERDGNPFRRPHAATIPHDVT